MVGLEVAAERLAHDHPNVRILTHDSYISRVFGISRGLVCGVSRGWVRGVSGRGP